MNIHTLSTRQVRMCRMLTYAAVCCFESVCICICRTLSPSHPYHNTDAIARLAARVTHVYLCVYVCVCAMHICANVCVCVCVCVCVTHTHTNELVFSMDFMGGT
jgi:hypothetical protein